MSRPPKPPDPEAPRDILDRVGRESETVGSSSLARAKRRLGDHFSGQDAVREAEGSEADWAEVWGRRIGRAISVVVACGLAWWLGLQLGWW